MGAGSARGEQPQGGKPTNPPPDPRQLELPLTDLLLRDERRNGEIKAVRIT